MLEQVIESGEKEQLTESPPKTFSLFSALPQEIQGQIWKVALPGPRVIEVRAEPLKPCLIWDPSSAAGFVGSYPTHRYKLNCSLGRFHDIEGFAPFGLLSIMHTCHASREVALQKFDTCLSNTPEPQLEFCKLIGDTWYKDVEGSVIPHSRIASPGVWFQPQHDTIYFRFSKHKAPLPTVLYFALATQLKIDNIQSVLLDDNILFLGPQVLKTTWKRLLLKSNSPGQIALFKQLKELIVVVEKPPKYDGTDLGIVSLRQSAQKSDYNQILLDAAIMTRHEFMSSTRWEILPNLKAWQP